MSLPLGVVSDLGRKFGDLRRTVRRGSLCGCFLAACVNCRHSGAVRLAFAVRNARVASDADFTTGDKRPLSFTEAAFLADNLETIEYYRDLQRNSRKQSAYKPNAQISLVGKIVLAIVWLALFYGFGGLLYAVVSALFLL